MTAPTPSDGSALPRAACFVEVRGDAAPGLDGDVGDFRDADRGDRHWDGSDPAARGNVAREQAQNQASVTKKSATEASNFSGLVQTLMPLSRRTSTR